MLTKPEMNHASAAEAPAKPEANVSFADLGRVGEHSLVGRYMRRFWQPVAHSHDVAVGRSKSVRYFNREYVIYRGQSGAAYVVDPHCPHRATPMVAAWIEGDDLRCVYHGWKFASSGQCIEQPAERKSFCDKVKLRSYPTREYLGLIFAYLGEDQAPAPDFPTYSRFDGENINLQFESYTRPSNFFNNLENLGDLSHLAYLHADITGRWDEYRDGPVITAKENEWGVEFRGERPVSGNKIVQYVGMPNVAYVKGPPNDQAVAFREFIAWWMPIDDDHHIQFTVVIVRLGTEEFAGYMAREDERKRKLTMNDDATREMLADKMLSGELRFDEMDAEKVKTLWLTDDFAQKGIGNPANRPPEIMGTADIGVALCRKVWLRELKKLAKGEPLKEWKFQESYEARGDYLS